MAEVNCAISHLADLSPNSNTHELLPFNELFNGPMKKLFGKTTSFQGKESIFPKTKPKKHFLTK